MIHGLDAAAIWLGGDVAVLEVNLHPLVGGLFQLLVQDFPAQEFAVLDAEGGNFLESLVLEQVTEADDLEMALDVGNPLVGVLEPNAVPGADGDVADGGEAATGRATREPLRVTAPELHIHQSAVADVVVVRRGEGLNDAGLHPLAATTQVPHAEGGEDAARRGLARVPAAGGHRRIHRAVAVRLPFHIEHPAGFGGNDTLVALYPAERAFLPKARDGAIDQPGMMLRQRVVIQPPAGHVAGAVGLHENVGLAGQSDGLLAPFLGFEVEHNAFLAAVPRNPGGLKPEGIPAGRLDLDHLGAVVGQNQGAEGARHTQREIEDG